MITDRFPAAANTNITPYAATRGTDVSLNPEIFKYFNSLHTN